MAWIPIFPSCTVACCMAQTVPSFVNALGMAAERKGIRLNFGISRGAGSIGFGLTAQLANVLLLRGGLRTVPLYSLCLAAILTATAFCFPRTAEDGTVTLRYDGGVIVLIHHDGHDTAEYTVHSHQCG